MMTAQSDPARYRTILTNGNHKAVSDTTEKNGGGNSGFRPHELLEGALASCLNIWVRMYADNHGIPLSSATVRVELDRSHPERAVFKYEIDPKGDLTEAQRRKLMQVAGSCPVHKTLSKSISLESVQASENRAQG